MALPASASMVVVVYIVIYIYSLLGMENFAYIAQNGDGISRHSNF